MNIAVCACGLALSPHIRGLKYCKHCDQPCNVKAGRCPWCKELNKVKG